MMQGNVAEIIRELMETQQLSVRKVSARIAEKHGGSVYGYTQQISRILNDPNYDPSLSTVQKILSALNVSLLQVSPANTSSPSTNFTDFLHRLDHLSENVSHLKQGLAEVQETLGRVLAVLNAKED